MRLVLTGRNVAITPPLREQVTKHLDKLERVLNDNAVSAQVVLTRERYRLLTDITLHARGDHMLSGVGAGTTWPLSVKNAVEKVEQQARRVKEKWTTRKRRGRSEKQLEPGVAADETAVVEAPLDVPNVLRTRYALQSMSLDEAAERFQSGAEPFVVYRDRVTGSVTIVFRRKDGRLGFFEPQVRGERLEV
jgi:putative sigma-54 modulation protein